MKKLLILTLALLLTLSLAACDGGGTSSSGNNTPSGNNSTPGGNDSTPGGNNTGDKLLAMTITVPQGWKKTATDVDPYGGASKYVPDGTGVYLTEFRLDIEENFSDLDERDYVKENLENHKNTFGSDYQYTPIADVTAGGHNALQYTGTMTGDSNGVIFSRTYINKGKYVYVIQWQTTAEQWENIHNDFDAMYESFALK